MAKLPKSLTPLESLIMNVVWDKGEVTVREVQNSLQPGRDLAYTSVLTMMQVLERKGFVASRKAGRANAYRATVTRARFGLRSAVDIVNSFFGGSVPAMMSHFADSETLSDDDMCELRQMFENVTTRHSPDENHPDGEAQHDE